MTTTPILEHPRSLFKRRPRQWEAGTRVHLHTGSEGPRHDPYHYTELTVWRYGHSYTIHTGLAVWIQIDNGPEVGLYGEDYKKGVEIFQRCTGYTPNEWETYYWVANPYEDDPMGHPSMYE